MVSWLKKLFNKKSKRDLYFDEQEALETPWATFEVTGFDENGIRVEFNWNSAFVSKIRSLGFEAETEEDCVQLFFYTSQMRPAGLSGDDPVQSTSHPMLSERQNIIVT